MSTESGAVSNNVFRGEFIPYIVKWGRGLNLLGVLLCFGPCLGLAFMGIFPPWEAFVAAFFIQFPLSMSAYIYEPISYFAVLGIPGSYMAFLSGNISNMRVPCSSVAQQAAGVEEGTEKGTIIATVGIAISIIVNITVLTAGIFLGSYTLSLLPPIVTQALNLLLPALFASLTTNYVMRNYKLAMVGLPISFAMVLLQKLGMLSFLPGPVASALPILISVFGTMGIGIVMAKKGMMN